MAHVGPLQRHRKIVVVVVVTLCLLINMSVLCSFKCGHIPQFHNCQSSCHNKLKLLTWSVSKVSVLIFLCTNWQRSTSLMYIGVLVVTLATCSYLFQLDWSGQSCATAVCVWSCFNTSLRLRCRKISNNGTLSSFPCNSTNLPQRHLLL